MVDVGAAVGAHLLGVAGGFDLDHFGAQQRQQFARVRAGPHFGELDDAHPFQRAAARILRRFELCRLDRRHHARRVGRSRTAAVCWPRAGAAEVISAGDALSA